jgi:hypothetical protein
MKASHTAALVIILFALAIGAMTFISSRSYFSSRHPLLDRVRDSFAKLDPEYAKIPLHTGDSSYTENKEVITLCLSDPDTGKYYNANVIIYVALHELAHTLTPSGEPEHGDQFKKNFAELLRRAAEAGIYDPRKAIPSTYCRVATK